jgi:anti-anti-sigma regulatory factor
MRSRKRKRRTIVCDVAALADSPDATTIDALARLQLTLRARGLEILLRGASAELVELIELVGLADVLRVEPERRAQVSGLDPSERADALRVEPGRQTEQRKQRGRVEEERELDDLSL